MRCLIKNVLLAACVKESFRLTSDAKGGVHFGAQSRCSERSCRKRSNGDQSVLRRKGLITTRGFYRISLAGPPVLRAQAAFKSTNENRPQRLKQLLAPRAYRFLLYLTSCATVARLGAL